MLRTRGDRGFTLLEMVVALAVLTAIVAALAPTMLSTAGSSRAGATLAEMAQLYDAILGDQHEHFGYVGDVGTYPVNLRDLAISNGATGWKGPYVGNARIENNRLIDPYGQPYEYYLVSGVSGSDQLAIVSRGPDGLSTNSPADPNLGASFALAPSSGSYAAGANNADNIVYPAVNGNTNALNVEIAGTLALNISNFDSNALVNAFVPACPNLYRVTVTSQTRGTNEVTNLGYAPGFQVDLPQGIYQVLVSAQNLSAAPFNEKLTVIPWTDGDAVAERDRAGFERHGPVRPHGDQQAAERGPPRLPVRHAAHAEFRQQSDRGQRDGDLCRPRVRAGLHQGGDHHRHPRSGGDAVEQRHQDRRRDLLERRRHEQHRQQHPDVQQRHLLRRNQEGQEPDLHRRADGGRHGRGAHHGGCGAEDIGARRRGEHHGRPVRRVSGRPRPFPGRRRACVAAGSPRTS